MAAFLIQELEKHCACRDRCESLFYYCYFGNSQDESIPLLHWIISQLCRQPIDIPSEVIFLYDRNHSVFTKTQLLSILQIVLRNFDSVFLTIDALDESQPRQPLLDLMRTLATDSRFRNLKLLATSREYLDIRETMSGISLSVLMDHEFIKEDIRIHVQSFIHTNRDFKRWPEAVRADIAQKLTVGAKGM